MPTRVEFDIIGKAPENPLEHARALQALVYQWISIADAQTAARLHSLKGIKPIAVTPDATSDGNGIHIRVSTLDDGLFYKLHEGIMRDLSRNDGKHIYLKAKNPPPPSLLCP